MRGIFQFSFNQSYNSRPSQMIKYSFFKNHRFFNNRQILLKGSFNNGCKYTYSAH